MTREPEDALGWIIVAIMVLLALGAAAIVARLWQMVAS